MYIFRKENDQHLFIPSDLNKNWPNIPLMEEILHHLRCCYNHVNNGISTTNLSWWSPDFFQQYPEIQLKMLFFEIFLPSFSFGIQLLFGQNIYYTWGSSVVIPADSLLGRLGLAFKALGLTLPDHRHLVPWQRKRNFRFFSPTTVVGDGDRIP